jgi:neutral ceramidase
VSAMAQAVHEAKGKLQPAAMAFGTGMAYLNVNRDAIQPVTHLWTQAPNLLAASDKTVAVLKSQMPSGEPIGVYVNYAMHPINGYLSNFTSADFAGAMSRYVEQAYDDKAVVIFSQRASGDQNPLYMRPSTNGMASRSGVPITGNVLVRESVEGPLRDGPVEGKPMDPKIRDRLERWMESEGQVLGEKVIRVMTNSTRMEQDVRIWGSQTVVNCPGRKRTDQGREGMAATYVDADPVPIRLGVLGIGDVALTSVDAEVYTLISQRLKHQSPMANTVMVTLANGAAPSGYIPDDASFSHNSFQVLGSRLKLGCARKVLLQMAILIWSGSLRSHNPKASRPRRSPHRR